MAFIGISVPNDVGSLLEQIEVPGNREPRSRYHVTVLNLGKEVPLEQVSKAAMVAFYVCSKAQPFLATMKVATSFPKGDDGFPIIARVESPALHALHAALTSAFDGAGIEYSKKFPEFKPHVTLAYADTGMPDRPISPITWTVGEIIVWGGDKGENRIVVKIPLEYKSGTARMASVRVAARYQTACDGGTCTCDRPCSCGKPVAEWLG